MKQGFDVLVKAIGSEIISEVIVLFDWYPLERATASPQLFATRNPMTGASSPRSPIRIGSGRSFVILCTKSEA
jgi:hypothetical protein